MRKIVFLMALLSNLAFANYELERQCNNGDAESCFDLGNLYDVKQDYNKAMEFYSKSCEMGEALGCYNLGSLYYNGKGVKQDYKKAREFWSKACEMNNALGCGSLGMLYYKGKGVKQDYKKAMKFVIKTCEIDTKICDNAIEELYIKDSDYKNLMDIGNNLCEKDNAFGCILLGGLYYNGFGVKQDYKRAIKFLNKACDLGLKDACKKL